MANIRQISGRLGLGGLVFTVMAYHGGAVLAQSSQSGLTLAQKNCADCHVVEARQERINADVPSFAEIAKRPDFKASELAEFLAPPHPMGKMNLSTNEIADLVAYIASLGR